MSREATGDCYTSAGDWMIANCRSGGLSNGDAYLVHAEVTGQGPIAGLRYGHAFVLILPEGMEPTDRNIMYYGQVIDRSNARNIEMPAAFYFTVGAIWENDNFYLYDCDEAMRWMRETEEYGPWELETESGY
jgi:hypothetical protein